MLTGTAAANQAGPAITISYMAAGLACAFAALCYAEFAAMIPISGSAYTYAYATLGEIIAWMIGWDLILEYAVGSMTVAIGWSGYFQRILAGFGWHLPAWMCRRAGHHARRRRSTCPAVLIVLAITALLVIGIRESARFNAAMVAIKLAAVLFFIARRLQLREARELVAVRALRLVRDHGRGGGGVLRLHRLRRRLHHGGGGQEPQPRPADRHHLLARHLHGPVHRGGRRPHRDRARHLLPHASKGRCPGPPSCRSAESTAFLNAPVAYVLHVIDQDWAAGLISAGAVAGITSVLLVMLMGQPRIFFSMSRDRLLPEGVSKVHPRFGTPYITTIITGVVVAFFAAILPIDVVGEMTSIGTLFAFVVVCSAVIMLRIKRPEARRPFRVPFGYLFPVLGVLSCLYLMLSLSAVTWVRFLVWLDLGMMIYWFYGRTHSPLADKREQAAQGGAERAGNVVTMLGALGLFNGFFMTVLGFMTELGITTEATTKWHEIHVTPHQADTVGLVLLVAGAVVFFAGRVLAKSGGKPAAA